jgi:hypothetical protein
LLNDLDDMSLKGMEVVLNSDQVISVVVLSDNLTVETVQDTTVHNVRIIVAVKMTSGRVERSRMLAEKLDLLLGGVAGLLNLLGSLFSTMSKFLGLVLDLLVQALKDGKDGALDALLGLDVGVDKGLGVGAHVLEEASNAAEALVEVVTFLEGVVDGLLGTVSSCARRKLMLSPGSSYLERLLVLLGVVAVDSLHSLHIFLDVTNSMLPCLESLGEQTGGLFTESSARILGKIARLYRSAMRAGRRWE